MSLLQVPVAYCAIGLALALLFKDIRVDWWGLVILCSLISLYGYLAKGPKDKARYETGDNCYFIGFVFTLSIITSSLILDAEELIGGLGKSGLHPLLKTIGIALGTSVCGMLWRFGLTQGVAVGEEEFDRIVSRSALAAAKLEGTVTRLRGVVVDTEQSLGIAAKAFKVSTEEVQRESADLLQSSRMAIASLTEDLRSRLDSEVAAISESLRALSANVEDESRRHNASLKTELTSLLQQFEAGIGERAESIQYSLATVTESISNYPSALDESLQQVVAALNLAVQDSVRQVSQGVANALQTYSFHPVRSALDAALQEHADGVAGVNRALSHSLARLNDATSASLATADDTRDAVNAVREAINGTVVGLGPTVQRFAENVEELSGRLSRLAQEQVTATAQAEHYRSYISDIHREFERLLADIHNALADSRRQQSVRSSRPPRRHRRIDAQ